MRQRRPEVEGAGEAEGGGGISRESDLSPLIHWVHRRRPLLTAAFVVAVVGAALLDEEPPARLLEPSASALFVLPWMLMGLGVGVRIWGAGNLRKNQEITRTGIYRMVRHPLYLGSLSVFLAFFLTVGDPARGAALFLAMVVLVYYPTMISEEDHLRRHFPEQTRDYDGLPRLLPNVLRLPEALATDRFTLAAAHANLGVRSLGFLVALPIFLELLRWVEGGG